MIRLTELVDLRALEEGTVKAANKEKKNAYMDTRQSAYGIRQVGNKSTRGGGRYLSRTGQAPDLLGKKAEKKTGTWTTASGKKAERNSDGTIKYTKEEIEKLNQTLDKLQSTELSPEQKKKLDELLGQMEALVGGQKKLDVDGDGKLEKSDFEKLRAQKEESN